MTTLRLRKWINRSPLRRGLLLIPLALGCFALASAARAVSPPPDGGYPGNNTAEGTGALLSLTSGNNNTAEGAGALQNLTTGTRNTANGAYTLFSNTTGSNNTADGFDALRYTTTIQYSSGLVKIGQQNTAAGSQALYSNTTGSGNTAAGYQALFHNTAIFNSITNTLAIGEANTASGSQALYSNTTGSGNTAMGSTALFSNTTSSGTTATGYQALYHNTTGPGNTATGYRSLVTNTTGSGNSAIGSQALQANISGNSNTAIGRLALASNTSGDHNIALGQNAGQNITTGGSNIDIGNTGAAGDNGIIRVGDIQNDAFISNVAHFSNSGGVFIKGISGRQEGGTMIQAVYINGNGQLGVQGPPSSRRFKKEIKPMDQTSEAILDLKPVTFQYKTDTKGTLQFGLIAEEVERVNPDLVTRDDQGKVYTVRYEAVNAMLLNEFLKEHSTVQEMKSTLAKHEAIMTEHRKDFESKLVQQQQQIETLTAGLQKVSAQLEASKSAPQVVNNNH